MRGLNTAEDEVIQKWKALMSPGGFECHAAPPGTWDEGPGPNYGFDCVLSEFGNCVFCGKDWSAFARFCGYRPSRFAAHVEPTT